MGRFQVLIHVALWISLLTNGELWFVFQFMGHTENDLDFGFMF